MYAEVGEGRRSAVMTRVWQRLECDVESLLMSICYAIDESIGTNKATFHGLHHFQIDRRASLWERTEKLDVDDVLVQTTSLGQTKRFSRMKRAKSFAWIP